MSAPATEHEIARRFEVINSRLTRFYEKFREDYPRDPFVFTNKPNDPNNEEIRTLIYNLDPTPMDNFLHLKKEAAGVKVDGEIIVESKKMLYVRYAEFVCSFVVCQDNYVSPDISFWNHIIAIVNDASAVCSNILGKSKADFRNSQSTFERERNNRVGFFNDVISRAICVIVRHYLGDRTDGICETVLGQSLRNYLNEFSKGKNHADTAVLSQNLGILFAYVHAINTNVPTIRASILNYGDVPNFMIYQQWFRYIERHPTIFSFVGRAVKPVIPPESLWESLRRATRVTQYNQDNMASKIAKAAASKDVLHNRTEYDPSMLFRPTNENIVYISSDVVKYCNEYFAEKNRLRNQLAQPTTSTGTHNRSTATPRRSSLR